MMIVIVMGHKSQICGDHCIRYFLYLSMFLWRISYMGPRSLLKESL